MFCVLKGAVDTKQFTFEFMGEDSAIPFWGSSMATAMKSSIKTNASHGGGNSTDRALGAAASLGLCLAILRVVGSAYSASRHIESGDCAVKYVVD